jgi:hypothetical protein
MLSGAMTTRSEDELSRTYREAAGHLASESQAAARRAQKAMASTVGWEAAAKAAAAQSVLEATMAACDALVAELFEVYLDRGERNAEAVATDVRERLLKSLTAPGLGFFVDSEPVSAGFQLVAIRHAAEFESWREKFAEQLAARFLRARETRERRIPMLELPSAWQRVRESRAAFAFLLATAGLSACGVSWADIARKVAAFL